MADAPLERATLARDGIQVLRGFLPEAACRAAMEHVRLARVEARRRLSPDAQRLQPVSAYLSPAQAGALAAVADFDRLNATFREIVAPDAGVESRLLGLWIEPASRTYVLPWHRDLRDNGKGLDWAAWYERLANPKYFNQFHLALVDDRSFWVVPGSHSRDDTPTERKMFPDRPIVVDFVERELDPWYDGPRPTGAARLVRRARQRLEGAYYASVDRGPLPWYRARNAAVAARAETYCRAMPGAVEVALRAGDLMIYRNSSWHTAIYRADEPRFTLFSNVSTPESSRWSIEQKERSLALGAAAGWYDGARAS